VCVQSKTTRHATVGHLTNKQLEKRTIHATQAVARTLTAHQTCIRKVKKVSETLHESISISKTELRITSSMGCGCAAI